MSIRLFEQWRSKYESILPIRGRTVECRPWGKRNRDHEQIVRVLTPTGIGYGARLYDTDCVVVAPNGDIYLKADSWLSVMTGQWIYSKSPFRCYKQYNMLWVDVNDRAIPITGKETLHIKFDAETGKYSCDKTVVMKQKVVDRSKSKVVRNEVKAFRDFAKTIMTLADGWVAEETLLLHRKMGEQGHYMNAYSYEMGEKSFNRWTLRGDRMAVSTATDLVGFMKDFNNLSDGDRVKLVLMVVEGTQYCESRVIRQEQRTTEYGGKPHTWTENTSEYRYAPKSVLNRIDYMVKKCSDVWTTKDVEVTKPITNLV